MSSLSHQVHAKQQSVAGRTFAGALLAAMGVVVAHGLGYLSSYPQAVSRRDALEGHAHLEAVGALFVVTGIATIVLLVVLAVRRVESLRELVPTWQSLASWQVSGFLALEFVERAGAPGEFITEPAILVGALIQVPVAWLLVRAIDVGAAVASRADISPSWLPIPWAATALPLTVQAFGLVPRVVHCSAISPRGPPHRLV